MEAAVDADFLRRIHSQEAIVFFKATVSDLDVFFSSSTSTVTIFYIPDWNHRPELVFGNVFFATSLGRR
jgi:hypothetical protein